MIKIQMQCRVTVKFLNVPRRSRFSRIRMELHFHPYIFLRFDIKLRTIGSAFSKIIKALIMLLLTLFDSESGLVCCEGYFKDQSTGECISKWQWYR